MANLAAWFVSDNPNNTTSGGYLTELADKSGNSRPASAYGGSSGRAAFVTTLNGRNVWRADSASGTEKGIFSISNINTLTNAVGGWTMFAVHSSNPAPGTTDQSVVRFNTNSTTARAMLGKGSVGSNYAYAGGRRLDANSIATSFNATGYGTDWIVTAGVFNYSTANLVLTANGLAATNASFQTAGVTSATDSASNGIGHDGAGGAIADGDFAEILIYNRALSVGERQAVEGWLAWQWGLTGSLTATHPYKTSPPAYPFLNQDNARATMVLTGDHALEISKGDTLVDNGQAAVVLTGTYA